MTYFETWMLDMILDVFLLLINPPYLLMKTFKLYKLLILIKVQNVIKQQIQTQFCEQYNLDKSMRLFARITEMALYLLKVYVKVNYYLNMSP